MGSVNVNASQLLASFLGSEKEKIGQGIVQGDFTGELKKLMPPPSDVSKPGAGTSGKDATSSPVGRDTADSKQPPLPAAASNAPSPATQGSPGSKISLPPPVTVQKTVSDSKSKINAIKEKAQKEESLYVTNPAMAATVLSDLQCPAETIKACKDFQNKDGRISIKDLKSLLSTQPATGSESSAQVPAEHARALVESIVVGKAGASGKDAASGVNFKAPVQIKTEGSYSPEEFRGLVEKVLQQADTTGSQAPGQGSRHATGETARTSQTAQTIQSSQTIEGAQALKTGQTERLVATVIPSFIADRENSSTGKIFAVDPVNPKVETPSAEVSDVRDSTVESVSESLKYNMKQSAEKIAFGAEEPQATAPINKSVSTAGKSETLAATAPASSVVAESTAIPVKSLDSVLKYFDATIVSTAPQQSEEKAADPPAPGGPHDGLVAQAQNLAPQLKGVEKQADKPQEALSSGKITQDMAQQSDAARIKTVSAESSSNDSDESSYGGAPKQSAESSQKTQTQEPTAKLESLGPPAESGDGLRAAVTDGTETTPETIAAETRLQAESEAINARTQTADSSEKTQTQPPTAKLDSKGQKAESGDVLQTAVADMKEIKPMTIAAETGLQAESDTDGIPLQQQGDSDRETGRAVSSVDSDTPVEVGLASLETAESNVAHQSQDTEAASKLVEQQVESKDSAPESVIFQNPATAHQGSDASPPQADNSALNEFTYYDPHRSAELVQDVREQSAGAPGGQLVLDMEPDGLGKINIKVGSKKDEISVMATTQTEPAKEMLMKHSAELRQDLQEQGLMLGKFSVDVNGDKSSGGNYQEAYKAGVKITPPPKETKASLQATDIPAYKPSKVSRTSQISIFA